jgi:PIN domain nuclease of toxin-antitoxin system
MLNLDTHILVDALLGEVSKKERTLLSKEKWCISGIVLWEIAKLKQLGRIKLEVQSVEFSRILSQIQVIPLDSQICQMSTEMDFNSDPADELIAATSIIYNVPLLTRDKKILKSRLVPFAK